MDEQTTGQIYTWLAVTAMSAFVAVCGVFGVFLSRKSKESRVFSALNACWILMQTAVAHAEKELRPELQKALADGKLSKEEGAELKARVIRIFRDQAGIQLGEFVKLLGLSDSAVGVFVSGLLERAVDSKQVVMDASKVSAPTNEIPKP